MQNAGKLAGQTIFITGASRGIGKAIALKCARDGANVAIAAKTAEPHPKLPGTIYTAAKEVEAAGGKCLPCIVDVRSEEQVAEAVKKAADTFGGIDVLVNNASAISLVGTEALPMKTYDLMMSINTRGTYLCSKHAVPYLKQGKNPHILNISPPLNMKPHWFSGHVAYTMAKYGMSMCVLGMAREFQEDGIAVNALWPRTAIYTAAMEMLGGGSAVKSQCRTPDIMSDAAYAILTKTSKELTGQFIIDDEILQKEGITDFDQYKCVPDGQLMPDFFLDVDPATLREQMVAQGATPAFGGGDAGKGSTQLDQTFQSIKAMLTEDVVKSINGVYSFDLKDDGKWYLDLKTGQGTAGQGDAPNVETNCTFIMTGEDFVKMFAGKLNPTSAFMTGKMKIKGDLGLAMKLEKLMKKTQKS